MSRSQFYSIKLFILRHAPAVYMNQHLLWDLGERALWHFISTFGSSRIAKLASRRPSGLRKTTITLNSLAHRTTWLRSDFTVLLSI